MLDLYLQTYTTVYPMGLTRIRSLTHNWQKSFSFGISLNLLFGSASVSTGALCNLGELHCQLTNIKRILRSGTRIQGDQSNNAHTRQHCFQSSCINFTLVSFGHPFGVREFGRQRIEIRALNIWNWRCLNWKHGDQRSANLLLVAQIKRLHFHHFLAMRKECETSADKTSALSIMHWTTKLSCYSIQHNGVILSRDRLPSDRKWQDSCFVI